MTNENSARRPIALSNVTTGPSRRHLLKSGLLAAGGALVGGRGRAGGDGDHDGTDASARGVMFPYQFTPGARFTVREADLAWRPDRVDPAYAAHVIEYGFARSLRSFFFAETELAEGKPFRTATSDASTEADPGLVDVVAEPVDNG